MQLMSKVCAAFLFSVVASAAHADSSPAVGVPCDHWGQDSSMISDPMLTCSHGKWADASKLRQFGAVFVIRYPNGDVIQPIPMLSQSGVPTHQSRFRTEGNTKFGFEAALTMTEVEGSKDHVQVEGELHHWAGAQAVTTKIDKVVDLNKDGLVAQEPDGTTYTMTIGELRNLEDQPSGPAKLQ